MVALNTEFTEIVNLIYWEGEGQGVCLCGIEDGKLKELNPQLSWEANRKTLKLENQVGTI